VNESSANAPERLSYNAASPVGTPAGDARPKWSRPQAYPSLRERVVARAIDAVVVVIATFLVMPSLGDLPRGLMGIPLVVTAAAAVAAVYEVVTVGRWGQTLGKRIVQIKVVAAGGGVVGYERAAIRFIVVAAVPLSIRGFARAAHDPERRGLHDRIAGTVVVRWTPPMRFRRP
jgi:uncharacterized RDD family membrane protein YckC